MNFSKSIRSLVCVAVFGVLLSGCNDDETVTLYDDMIYFTAAETVSGYVDPLTRTTASPDSQLPLCISRSLFAARDYPKQRVNIVVDETLSTAVQGVDFDYAPRSLEFNKTWEEPFTVNIFSAGGKTIVLKLDYGYTKECPLERRKSDRLTIKIE